MSLNTIVFNDINSQIFNCFLGHIGGSKNEETNVSLYDIVGETVRRNGEIIDYGVKPSSPLEFPFTLIKCGEDKYFATDEIRQIVRWLQPDEDYHWLYGIGDENSHEETIYYLCRITNIQKYRYGGNIIGITATVRCNTYHGYSEEQIHTFNCFDTEGTTFKIFNDSDILHEVIRPQVEFNFSATGVNEETGEVITVPESYWAKQTTLLNDELEGVLVGNVANSNSYRATIFSDLSSTISMLQTLCMEILLYIGCYTYSPEYALAILRFELDLKTNIQSLKTKVDDIYDFTKYQEISDEYNNLHTFFFGEDGKSGLSLELKNYAEDVLEVVAKIRQGLTITTLKVNEQFIKNEVNKISTTAGNIYDIYKNDIYPVNKGYYTSENKCLERSSSLYLNPVEIDTTGTYKLLHDSIVYDPNGENNDAFGSNHNYFTKVILYVTSSVNSAVIELKIDDDDYSIYDNNDLLCTWENASINLNAGDKVTIVLEHSGDESDYDVDYTLLDESMRDDNGNLDGNKKMSTQQLASAFHLVLENNISQKYSGCINITNNTTGVISKITNISLDETVNLDCHNQIISSSIPNKIFSDDFNRNWIGLVSGYNEFTVDSFGTITIKFREARKVGDLL